MPVPAGFALIKGANRVAVQVSVTDEHEISVNRFDPLNVGESVRSRNIILSALVDCAANTKQTMNKQTSTVAFRSLMLFPPRSAFFPQTGACTLSICKRHTNQPKVDETELA